jgi:hypothetical protein
MVTDMGQQGSVKISRGEYRPAEVIMDSRGEYYGCNGYRYGPAGVGENHYW